MEATAMLPVRTSSWLVTSSGLLQIPFCSESLHVLIGGELVTFPFFRARVYGNASHQFGPHYDETQVTSDILHKWKKIVMDKNVKKYAVHNDDIVAVPNVDIAVPLDAQIDDLQSEFRRGHVRKVPTTPEGAFIQSRSPAETAHAVRMGIPGTPNMPEFPSSEGQDAPVSPGIDIVAEEGVSQAAPNAVDEDGWEAWTESQLHDEPPAPPGPDAVDKDSIDKDGWQIWTNRLEGRVLVVQDSEDDKFPPPGSRLQRSHSTACVDSASSAGPSLAPSSRPGAPTTEESFGVTVDFEGCDLLQAILKRRRLNALEGNVGTEGQAEAFE